MKSVSMFLAPGCLLALFLTACESPAPQIPASPPPALPTIVRISRPADAVSLSYDRDGALVIDATSPGGIGNVILQKPPTGWPKEILFQLRHRPAESPQRLEGFSISNTQQPKKYLADISNLSGPLFRTPVPATFTPDQIMISWIDFFR